MISRNLAFVASLTLLSVTAYAGPAPKELYGKSIIVTWGEQHSQRRFGETNFRDINASYSRKIYISTKGGSFNRSTAGAHENHGTRTSGTDNAMNNNVGGLSQMQYRGRTITSTGSAKGGLARRLTIEFNESFTTCEAHVIFAKQAGSDVVVGYNISTGTANKEIRSATVTSVSCSIRDGNVFEQ